LKSILPNKKIVILSISILLVLTIGFFALGYGGNYLDKDNLLKKDDNTNAIDLMSESLNKDSDSDGLRDWEETLWKTDVNNPDTDLDGTPDGEEVKLGRDPLKPGPDDKMEEKVVASLGQGESWVDSKSTTSSVNITELLAKNSGFHVADSFNSLSPNNKELLNNVNISTEKLLKDFIAKFNPVIPESEFNVSADNSEAAIEKYSNELIAIKKEAPANSPEIEGNILMDAVKRKDFTTIDEYSDSYLRVIEKYKSISVPSDFLYLHKKATELTMATVNVYNNIKKIDEDPLRAIIAIDMNNNIKRDFSVIIDDFNLLMQSKIK